MVGQELVGKIGSVSMRVRGGALCGEVRVVVGGLPHYYVAYSHEPIPVGTRVLVINSRGARQIDVEPWVDQGSDGAHVSPKGAK
jgi:membrane protein implicated in regulation of membrane protease activity